MQSNAIHQGISFNRIQVFVGGSIRPLHSCVFYHSVERAQQNRSVACGRPEKVSIPCIHKHCPFQVVSSSLHFRAPMTHVRNRTTMRSQASSERVRHRCRDFEGVEEPCASPYSSRVL